MCEIIVPPRLRISECVNYWSDLKKKKIIICSCHFFFVPLHPKWVQYNIDE